MATNSQLQETPECRSFREDYSSLYHAIQDPLSLATQLYSQGIIAPAVKEQMNMLGVSRLEKNSALLSAVEMKIQTDASVLHMFLATLNEDSSMQSLVESMQSKCLMCCCLKLKYQDRWDSTKYKEGLVQLNEWIYWYKNLVPLQTHWLVYFNLSSKKEQACGADNDNLLTLLFSDDLSHSLMDSR